MLPRKFPRTSVPMLKTFTKVLEKSFQKKQCHWWRTLSSLVILSALSVASLWRTQSQSKAAELTIEAPLSNGSLVSNFQDSSVLIQCQWRLSIQKSRLPMWIWRRRLSVSRKRTRGRLNTILDSTSRILTSLLTCWISEHTTKEKPYLTKAAAQKPYLNNRLDTSYEIQIVTITLINEPPNQANAVVTDSSKSSGKNQAPMQTSSWNQLSKPLDQVYTVELVLQMPVSVWRRAQKL